MIKKIKDNIWIILFPLIIIFLLYATLSDTINTFKHFFEHKIATGFYTDVTIMPLEDGSWSENNWCVNVSKEDDEYYVDYMIDPASNEYFCDETIYENGIISDNNISFIFISNTEYRNTKEFIVTIDPNNIFEE